METAIRCRKKEMPKGENNKMKKNLLYSLQSLEKSFHQTEQFMKRLEFDVVLKKNLVVATGNVDPLTMECQALGSLWMSNGATHSSTNHQNSMLVPDPPSLYFLLLLNNSKSATFFERHCPTGGTDPPPKL